MQGSTFARPDDYRKAEITQVDTLICVVALATLCSLLTTEAQMKVRRELHERARRLGLGSAMSQDPWARASMTMLEHWCEVMTMALEDEGCAPELVQRIVSRVIVGALPNPSDVELRIDMQAARVVNSVLGVDSRTELRIQDLRFETCRAGFETVSVQVMHMPTGLVETVDCAEIGELEGRRLAIVALTARVASATKNDDPWQGIPTSTAGA